MTKFDFIENLKMALTGKINPSELADTIQYYEDYIDGEIRKGESEKRVLEKLGDPRLLAKSIIAANHVETERENNVWSEEDAGDKKGFRFKGIRLSLGVWIVMIVLVFVLMFGLVTKIIWFFLPVMIPIMLVTYFVRMFRRK